MISPQEEIVRCLGAAVRASELYSPAHPQVQRAAAALVTILATPLTTSPTVIVAFLEDDIVLNDFRLPRGPGALAGLLRDMRERKIEKITFARGVELSDIRTLMEELADRMAHTAVNDRLLARGIRRILVSRLIAEEVDDSEVGLAAAQQMYSTAVTGAETIWSAAKAGDQPNPSDAKGIIDSLSKLVY